MPVPSPYHLLSFCQKCTVPWPFHFLTFIIIFPPPPIGHRCHYCIDILLSCSLSSSLFCTVLKKRTRGTFNPWPAHGASWGTVRSRPGDSGSARGRGPGPGQLGSRSRQRLLLRQRLSQRLPQPAAGSHAPVAGGRRGPPRPRSGRVRQ